MQRQSSKAEIYLHFVWATRGRQLLLTPESEREVYRCIEQEARRLDCQVLAIGGMPDHVPLAVKLPAKVSAAKLMQQIKGVSSAFLNDLRNQTGAFRWQEGYAAFSVCRPHIKMVIAYIENQKQHHAQGSTWASLEDTGEEAD
ncbi:MAG TPA: IS200/IS605 family transposase [Chthonomonadaceae bacterium]|nr:IS200/IS605 family transposase [Chthonomonadaceae bacterium]